MRRSVLVAAGLLAVALSGPVAARDLIRPAELPPPDYAGEQYVDSRGCLFMRAGTPGNTLWLPRVTREGVPLCGNPPSGRRVPVVEEGAAAAPLPEATPEEARKTASEAAVAPVVATGHFVAVGSFGLAENVTRAEARLAALNYATARGRAQANGLVTVYAGPFATGDEAGRARSELAALGFPDAIVVRAGP
jgi:hypothetical protein